MTYGGGDNAWFGLANLINNLSQTNVSQQKGERENTLLTQVELPVKKLAMEKEAKDYIRSETPVNMQSLVQTTYKDKTPEGQQFLMDVINKAGLGVTDDNGNFTNFIRAGDLPKAHALLNDPVTRKHQIAFEWDTLKNRESELGKLQTAGDVENANKLSDYLNAHRSRLTREYDIYFPKDYVSEEKASRNPITGEVRTGTVTSPTELAVAAAGGDPKAGFDNYMKIVQAMRSGSGSGSKGKDNFAADKPANLKAASSYFLNDKAQYLTTEEERSEGKKFTEAQMRARLGTYIPGFLVTYGDLQNVEETHLHNRVKNIKKAGEDTWTGLVDESAKEGRKWLTQGGAAQHSQQAQRFLIDKARSHMSAAGGWGNRALDKAINETATQYRVPRAAVVGLVNAQPQILKEIGIKRSNSSIAPLMSAQDTQRQHSFQ